MSKGLSRRNLLGGLLAGMAAAGLGARTAQATEWFRPEGLGPKGPRYDGYALACGEMASAHHSAGAALQALSKAKESVDTVLRFALRATKGSEESLNLLAQDGADFAVVSGAWERWAVEGKGPWSSPMAGLRSICTLWPSVEHVVVRAAHVRTGTLADLAAMEGLPFAVGRKDTDSETSGRLLLKSLGASGLKLHTMGATAAAVAMAEGRVEGAIIPAPLPAAPVTEAFIRMKQDVVLLGSAGQYPGLAEAGMNGWSPYAIPAGTYPGQDRTLEVLAQPVTLLARDDIDPWAVQRLTAAMFDNLAFFANLHKDLRYLALPTALVGLVAPLHPGALAYYRAKGLEVPAGLVV